MEAWPEDCRGEEPRLLGRSDDQAGRDPLLSHRAGDHAGKTPFAAGNCTTSTTCTSTRSTTYKKEHPDELRIKPHLASYFYRFNVTKKPCDDVRVRKALAMALDRGSITKNVTKGEQMPALFYTPPGVAGYTARARIEENVRESKATARRGRLSRRQGLSFTRTPLQHHRGAPYHRRGHSADVGRKI